MALINIINRAFIPSTLRIEAEFYKKEYLDLKAKLLSLKHTTIARVTSQSIMTGHTPSMKNPNYYGGEIKFIKTDNLRDNEITRDFTHTLSANGNKQIARTNLIYNDLLITIIGATHEIIGRSCLVDIDILPANINQNIALVRVDKRKILPEFLLVYLMTIYGKKYLHYLSRQTGQVNLNCQEVGQLIVPIFSNEFQNKICHITTETRQLKAESLAKYKLANNLLLNEIGLLDWQPMNKSTFSKSLMEVKNAKRSDAEHFQPKYDAILKKITSCKHGSSVIRKKFTQVLTTKEKINSKYYYTEIGDVNIHTSDVESNFIGTNNLPANAKYFVENGDLLISKVRPYRGAVGIVEKQSDDLIVSSAFTILRENSDYFKETLQVLMRTNLYKNLLMKWNIGTSYPVIRDKDILNLLIPNISAKIQLEIRNLVKESHSARKKAENLILIAKETLEIAIEQNEEMALLFLNKSY